MNIVWYYLYVESKEGLPGASRVVQGLGLWVFNVGGMGFILGWGTKFLHATWQKIKIKKLDKKANLLKKKNREGNSGPQVMGEGMNKTDGV